MAPVLDIRTGISFAKQKGHIKAIKIIIHIIYIYTSVAKHGWHISMDQ